MPYIIFRMLVIRFDAFLSFFELFDFSQRLELPKSSRKIKQFIKMQKSIKKNCQLPEQDIGHVSFLF